VPKNSSKISEQMVAAILASPESRESICRAVGIDRAVMSRFVNGKGWLGREAFDRLAAHLGLELTGSQRKER
jgi:hypothetical protein